MKKSTKTLPLICWSLAIIATAVLYGLLVDGLFASPIKVISVCFVLLAEIMLCVKTVFAKGSFILSTRVFTGFVYLALTFVLSLIFINANAVNNKHFAAIHIILFVLLIISDIAIAYRGKQASASDEKLYKSQSVIASCKMAIDTIIVTNPETELKVELTEISESLKYSDNSKLSGEEHKILAGIEEIGAALKDSDNETAAQKIKDVKALIAIRNIYMKDQQRGKI